MERIELKKIIEALLFASSDPLSVPKLKSITEASTQEIRSLIIDLQNEYMVHNHAFQITEVASGYLLLTLNEYDGWINKLVGEKRRTRLSQAALETLAIIAYKQPIIRAEVEAIRGVNSDSIIGQLLAKNLVALAGRADTIGRPHYLRTTKQFLDYFGLKTLDDLPSIEEIEKILRDRANESQTNLFPQEQSSLTIPQEQSTLTIIDAHEAPPQMILLGGNEKEGPAVVIDGKGDENGDDSAQ